VVLNKCDLLSESQRRRVEKFLWRRNPRALLMTSTFGRIDSDLLFATSAQRFRRQNGASLSAATAHLHHDGVEAFTYTTHRALHRQHFERFLGRLPRAVYRAKGIVCFDHEQWSSIFNYTCGRYNIDWFLHQDAFKAPCQAVFIGKHLHRQQQRLLAQLAACELPPLPAA
jgi:G3E family GTPase